MQRTYPIRSNLKVAVSGATNALPVVITTGDPHELVTADTVDITGVIGNLAANVGGKAVTVLSTTTFSLAGIKGSGDYPGFSGEVESLDAKDRDYAAVTALEGSVHQPAEGERRFDFYVDAASDPGTSNKEVDVIVYGRGGPDAAWFLIKQIDHATAGWARVGSGRWVNKALDLRVHAHLRIDILAEAGSTNTVKAWIAT
jgi:hypothetical protein